ncbi:MAG: hypothetical protein ACOY94_18675 [Bacillota bacterium]
MKFSEWAKQNPLQVPPDHVVLAELSALIGSETEIVAVAARVESRVHIDATLHILTPTSLIVAAVAVENYSSPSAAVFVDVWPLSKCLQVAKKVRFESGRNAPYSQKSIENLAIQFEGGEVVLVNQNLARQLTGEVILEREALAAKLANMQR